MHDVSPASAIAMRESESLSNAPDDEVGGDDHALQWLSNPSYGSLRSTESSEFRQARTSRARCVSWLLQVLKAMITE